MMKTVKKLILWTLVGVLLGPFACLQVSNTAECSIGGELDVAVDFGVQRWSADLAYCTFPRLTVTGASVDSIKFGQISFSGAGMTNAKITQHSRYVHDDGSGLQCAGIFTKRAVQVQFFSVYKHSFERIGDP